MTCARDYHIEGGVLTVKSALDYAFSRGFREACRALLNSDERDIAIDLVGHTYITSIYLGMLMDAGKRAQELGKNLVVRASSGLVRFFDAVDLGCFVRIEIVGPDGARPDGRAGKP